MRQALAVLGAEAAGAPGRAGVPAAVAVELVHVFSLLHDDIMDGDPARRGRPTVWKAYGTGPAVLAGDALFALAVETLVDAGSDAVRRLSAALSDLVRGQADDLLFATRPWTGPERVRPEEVPGHGRAQDRRAAGLRGGAGRSARRGAPAAVAALDRAGRHLGVAFQIVDDVLGIWGDPLVTGKPVHGDLRERKKTFPVLAALDSPTSAAARLARLLESGGPPQEMADLVEECGGRSAALAEARRRMALAETAYELRPLLDYLLRRDL